MTELPGRAGWEAALERATTVIAHANFLTDGIREHATVVFPAESYAEKDGTLTHPDGRLQRLRAAIGHPGDVRAGVVGDRRARPGASGLDLGVLTGPMATAQLAAAVPFYAGLTLDEIGGRGVRWQARDAAGAFPAGRARRRAARARRRRTPPPRAGGRTGACAWGPSARSGTRTEVRVSPALHFLHPRLRVEMAPADAQRLELFQGDHVVVGSDGQRGRRHRHPARGHARGQRLPARPTRSTGPLVEVRKA